jgi:DHA2 family multidrug resistance protein
MASPEPQSSINPWFIAITVTIATFMELLWEWRHDDPVMEVVLLRNRNFALPCSFYFLFGALLFGSTVLIPQVLQAFIATPQPRPGSC